MLATENPPSSLNLDTTKGPITGPDDPTTSAPITETAVEETLENKLKAIKEQIPYPRAIIVANFKDGSSLSEVLGETALQQIQDRLADLTFLNVQYKHVSIQGQHFKIDEVKPSSSTQLFFCTLLDGKALLTVKQFVDLIVPNDDYFKMLNDVTYFRQLSASDPYIVINDKIYPKNADFNLVFGGYDTRELEHAIASAGFETHLKTFEAPTKVKRYFMEELKRKNVIEYEPEFEWNFGTLAFSLVVSGFIFYYMIRFNILP